jgi:hypothetical protein
VAGYAQAALLHSGAAIALIGGASGMASAEPSPAPPAPQFQLIRFDEDYAYLASAERPLTSWEQLKYVPLDDSGSAWISFGGELRERWEYQRNPDFGAERGRSSVWLQRATMSADLRLGPLRLYGQLLHAVESGRPGGPSPVDENRLDVQNAFLELRPGTIGGVTPVARLGRQEVRLGSGRLVDPREGPNVRRTFDGARLVLERGAWTLNGLVVLPR